MLAWILWANVLALHILQPFRLLIHGLIKIEFNSSFGRLKKKEMDRTILRISASGTKRTLYFQRKKRNGQSGKKQGGPLNLHQFPRYTRFRLKIHNLEVGEVPILLNRFFL
jgi:hypothetical protein